MIPVIKSINKQQLIQPKHHNHKFQRDYEKVIQDLKSINQLKVGNLIQETKKMLDNHVEYHYNNLTKKEDKKTEISIELLNSLYLKISALEKENEILKSSNDALDKKVESLNEINMRLHKQVFELEDELKTILEGIIN